MQTNEMSHERKQINLANSVGLAMVNNGLPSMMVESGGWCYIGGFKKNVYFDCLASTL